MTIKLYKVDSGPPSRATMMACHIFGVPAEMHNIDIPKKENRNPDYLKKNPLHTVPVLEDGDLVIHDSHAILMYLADTYGKDDGWYPKDTKKRALVNQKLFFETSVVFPRLLVVGRPAFREGVNRMTESQREDILEVYHFLEEFLTRSKFLAGDRITIADLSVFASITALVYIVPLDTEKYAKTDAWIKEMEKQPFSEKYNKPGATILGEALSKVFHK